MNYKDIEVSEDHTHFLYKGQPLFGKTFHQVLKFHAEGLAPVRDDSGWYHINLQGNALYKKRYTRTFGFYQGLAAVQDVDKWYHITTEGLPAYNTHFAWCGNFQEMRCVVRNYKGRSFHILPSGQSLTSESYRYAGDFKEGFAVVKLDSGMCMHIDKHGIPLNGRLFHDLGVFHKAFATARDTKGWFHINRSGQHNYAERYLMVEPFYNGFALVESHQGQKYIIDEAGNVDMEV